MEQKTKNNKKTLLYVGIAIVLVALIAVFAIVAGTANTPAAARSTPPTAHGVASETDTVTKTIQTDAEFLRGALEQENLVQGEESQYGLFVKTVNGVTADDAQQQWWCFTKGGEMVNTGVDDTPIADGDTFEITLTTGW